MKILIGLICFAGVCFASPYQKYQEYAVREEHPIPPSKERFIPGFGGGGFQIPGIGGSGGGFQIPGIGGGFPGIGNGGGFPGIGIGGGFPGIGGGFPSIPGFGRSNNYKSHERYDSESQEECPTCVTWG